MNGDHFSAIGKLEMLVIEAVGMELASCNSC